MSSRLEPAPDEFRGAGIAFLKKLLFAIGLAFFYADCYILYKLLKME